jgi:hypothetical protein
MFLAGLEAAFYEGLELPRKVAAADTPLLDRAGRGRHEPFTYRETESFPVGCC